MDFQLKPELTPDLILSKVTEEQIMSYYLGIQINKTKKLFCSPLRRDKNPTCSFYRNKSGKLIFKDFATSQHLDVWNVVMTKYNCSYWNALKIIANDFNILKDDTLVKNKGKIIDKNVRIEEKEFTKVQVAIKEFSESELKWWAQYGITPSILKKYDVYSCEHIFINGILSASSQQHCPIYGYYGHKYKGEELWRCYFPKRKSYRFLGNYPSKIIQGYNQLPKKGKLLIITKSMKDVMCLHSLGIPACAPCSETQFMSESILNDLKSRFKYIIVLYDNDETGIKFMRKIKKEYPELIYSFIPRDLGAKDVSDLYKLIGESKIKQLINQYLLWLKNIIENTTTIDC